jgi:hypothetical protein
MAGLRVFMQVHRKHLEEIAEHIHEPQWCLSALQNWFIGYRPRFENLDSNHHCPDHSGGYWFCKYCQIVCEVENRLVVSNRIWEMPDYLAKQDKLITETNPLNVMIKGLEPVGIFYFLNEDYIDYIAENFSEDLTLETFVSGFEFNRSTRNRNVLDEVLTDVWVPKEKESLSFSPEDVVNLWKNFRTIIAFYKSAHEYGRCVLIRDFSTSTSAFDYTDTQFYE